MTEAFLFFVGMTGQSSNLIIADLKDNNAFY